MAETSRGRASITAPAPDVELGRDDLALHFMYDDYAFALFDDPLLGGTQRAATPAVEDMDVEFDPEDELFTVGGAAGKKAKKEKVKTPKKRAANTLAEADINLPDAHYDLDLPQPLDFDLAGEYGGFEGAFVRLCCQLETRN
jgi:hypothetical protein